MKKKKNGENLNLKKPIFKTDNFKKQRSNVERIILGVLELIACLFAYKNTILIFMIFFF